MSAHRISSLSAVGFVVVAGLALPGCSGSAPDETTTATSSAPAPSESESADGGGSDQSVAEACGVLQEGIQAIQTDLTENLSTFQTDPAAASVALDELASTFSANVDEVTNADVSSVATPAESALTSLTEQFAALAADPASADVDALTQTATEVQTTFIALGEVCT